MEQALKIPDIEGQVQFLLPVKSSLVKYLLTIPGNQNEQIWAQLTKLESMCSLP